MFVCSLINALLKEFWDTCVIQRDVTTNQNLLSQPSNVEVTEERLERVRLQLNRKNTIWKETAPDYKKKNAEFKFAYASCGAGHLTLPSQT